MSAYEEKLLTILVEKYRKSKKDSNTNVITRKTKIIPSMLYKKYAQNDGNIDEIAAVNAAAAHCKEMGFVDFICLPFSDEMKEIWLVDDRVEEAEKYLEENYGYESKSSKRWHVERMIATYSGISPAAEAECAKLRAALDQNKIPQKYFQTEQVLRALAFIEKNQADLFLREASMLIYGDSKYLEENTLHAVCQALRDTLKMPCDESEMEDEVLESYHIFRERRKLCIKGNVTIRIRGKELEVGALKDGMVFFSDELDSIECVRVDAPNFVTVENYTSWLRMDAKNAVIFYLGGYADRFQRDFLKKIHEDNINLSFFHFGDIDAGGLYIHEHLCRMTGIPFQMYHMSVGELRDERFASCLRPLTASDQERLKSLEQKEDYRELATYMLDYNVKLEQEIVSYWL